MKTCTKLASACVVASALMAPAINRAEVVNLSVAADTFINSGNPNNNAGGTGWFDAGADGAGGVRRGLFRFDLGSIPAGSTITSAVVQLTVTRVPFSLPVDSTFDLFRLEAAWGEGNQAGTSGLPATNGQATWNARMFSTAAWTAPGA